MAYQGTRVKNPYEQPGPSRAPAPPSAPSVMPGAQIGPQAGGQRQVAPSPSPNPYQVPRSRPGLPAAPSLPSRGGSPVRQPPIQPPAQQPAPPVTPAPTTPPVPSTQAPAGTAGQATFTAVPNQAGGLSGYGQGGVWNSSVVTGATGGAIGGGGGTGGPKVTMNDGRTHRERFGTGETTINGMRVINPFAGESDPATQQILKTLQGQGITYLPGAQSIYRLLQSGVSPENALKHYQAIYAKYGDTPNGYDAFMAGHGANFRSNIDTTLDLRQGRGFGVTGWNEGSIGPVSQNRYRPPTAKGWGSQTGTRGTPAPPAEMPVYTPGDEVTGGEPEVIGGGNRGTTPAPSRGSQGKNPPDRRLAPGATPGTYTGGPGTLPPPPEEEPEPTPRPRRGKTGETPDWSVSPSQAEMLLTGLARLLGM